MIFGRKKSLEGKIDIEGVYPFDKDIFTQGLIKCNDDIIVSSGHYNTSFVGKLDLNNGKVNNKKKLEKNFFAEGIVSNNDFIIQLTWKENIAFFRNPETLEIEKYEHYAGEGWGICYDEKYLYISDGSHCLKRINNQNFQIEEIMEILYEGNKLNKLNDLEYYDGYIYANVWKSRYIYKINLSTKRVERIFNCAELINYCKKINRNINELNGIAHIKDNLFLISGKNWPRIFLVRLT